MTKLYTKQYRSTLEFAVPAWNGALTDYERRNIERVQKMALNIILGDKFLSYDNALKMTNLECLKSRRVKLCLKFARKAEKNKKHNHWFRQRTYSEHKATY